MDTIAVVKGILTLALVIFICYMIVRTKKSVKRYKNAKSNKKVTKTVSKSSRSRSTSKGSTTSRKSRPSDRTSKSVRVNNSSSYRQRY